MKTEPIIEFDSEESAHQVTVTGWVSRHGRFYGKDERAARWDGCTHIKCTTCGKPTEKHYLICNLCRQAKDDADWAACPRKDWDGKSMVYSETLDRYYNSPDDAEDDVDGEDVMTLDELRLVICEPNYAHELTTEIYSDLLDEDYNVPPSIEAAMDAYNKAIKECEPLSWSPGKYALKTEPHENPA